jgi:hypothetical protein
MQNVIRRSFAHNTFRKARFNIFSSRLFGTKRGVPNSPLGDVSIYNDQEALKNIDVEALEATVRNIQKIIG